MIRICTSWLRSHVSFFSRIPAHSNPQINRIQNILNKRVNYKEVTDSQFGTRKVVRLSWADHEKLCEHNFNETIKKIAADRALKKQE